MWLRRIFATVTVLLLASANIVDMVSCSIPAIPANCTMLEDTGKVCLYPSYFSYFGVLVLITASLPASLSYLCKTTLMIAITAVHCAMNLTVLAPALHCEEALNHRDFNK